MIKLPPESQRGRPDQGWDTVRGMGVQKVFTEEKLVISSVLYKITLDKKRQKGGKKDGLCLWHWIGTQKIEIHFLALAQTIWAFVICALGEGGDLTKSTCCISCVSIPVLQNGGWGAVTKVHPRNFS